MRTKLDIALVREGKLNLQGWAFGKDPEREVGYRVTDRKGQEIEGTTIESVRRDSVASAFFPDYEKQTGHPLRRELGFDINVPYRFGSGESCILEISADGRTRRLRFDDKRIESFNSHAHKKREKLLALLNPETVEVAWDCLRESGPRVLFRKAIHRLRGISEDYDYNEWYKKTRCTEETLQQQRETRFPSMPRFAVVIPVYRTPEKFLRRMLESLRAQTYSNFEVLAADASQYEGLVWEKNLGKLPREVLAEYQARDPRFRFEILAKNLGISENTNAAIRLCSPETDFVVLADHDDELAPEALFQCAKKINEHPDAKLIYTDEDKIDFESAYLFEPHFKTDYNPDLLRSVNYITHLFVVERALLESISEPDPESGKRIYERKEYDGAQDYDLILRACEAADRIAEEQQARSGLSAADERLLREGRFTSRNILHIPMALYHWRSHQLSTAANPEAKLYAFSAGERAITAHCRRLGLPVRRVEKGITYGFYHTQYEIARTEQGVEPLVSVIIPNKDHSADLDLAIRSLMKGDYQNLEFIVVENNSEKPETFSYYEEIQREFPSPFTDTASLPDGESPAERSPVFMGKLARPAVRVVHWKREFNYSAINNFGVRFTHGRYLLFLNNDIELIREDSLREMLQFVQREDVGICGARLLYPDGVIQHGGVVMGFGGIAGAAFIGIHDKENTYMHRAKCIQDYSAVTAACLLSKRESFDAVSGFTEELAVAFNDVDYCMKVRALGQKVVYNPYALFFHYESKSRGLEDTPEKVARFNREIIALARRWPEILREGDPYYNPNLTLRKSNFVLRDLTKEKPGEPFPLEILKGIV